jgi:hypothetical protein
MQFRIAMLQLFQFSTSEKRTDSACYGGGRIGGYAFELVRAYLGFYLFEFLFSKSYLLLLVPLGFLYTLQFGFLLLNNEVVPFQMLFTCNSFCLPTFHQKYIGSQGLHGCHILVIEFLALSGFVVHPIENDMSVIIRLEPLSSNLETLPVFGFGLSAQPMSFIFVQEDLQRSNTPALFALLAKFTHICQCGVWPDEQYTFTDWRTSCHFDYFAVLAFAFTLFLLHGTTCLFLDHAFDVIIVRPQVGSAEAGIYPLFVVDREFRNDIDFGLADVTHILGSPTVMSLA